MATVEREGDILKIQGDYTMEVEFKPGCYWLGQEDDWLNRYLAKAVAELSKDWSLGLACITYYGEKIHLGVVQQAGFDRKLIVFDRYDLYQTPSINKVVENNPEAVILIACYTYIKHIQ